MFLLASLSVPAAANASDSTGSSSGRGLGHKVEIIVTNLLLLFFNAIYLDLHTVAKTHCGIVLN